MKKNRLFRRIRNWSLGTKMLMIIITACIILLCSNYVSLEINRQAYDEMLYIKTAQVFTSFVEYVEVEFERLSVISLSILGDNNIQKYLITLRDEPVASEQWRDAKKDLATSVRSYSYNMAYCRNFGIYASRGVAVGSFTDLPSDTKGELARMAEEWNGAPRIVLYGDNLYFIRQIRQKENLVLDNLGTMIGTMDMERLFRECSRAYESMDVDLNLTVYLDDTLIYQTGEKMAQLDSDGWQIIGDHFVVQSTTSEGWVYLVHLPYDEIYDTLKATTMRTLTLTVVIALLATFIGYMLIKRVTRHLDKLLVKFDAYGNGILPTKEEMLLYQDRRDEIGRLHRHFDIMAYEYKQLNDKSYNLMLLQKEAQYKQLQQQIQPHFIFNTLSHITWIAYEHKDPEIAELSNALSRMMRNSMTFSEKTVRLADELKLVEDYMLIQRRRFQSRLDFEIHVDPKLEDIRIPQMTIQPIVENAIKYVLEEELDTCTIRVLGRQEGQAALIIVEDNGPGIDEEIMEKLETQQIKAKGNGIGLRNIQKRLQLVFSEEYGLSFHRVDGRTQVWIRLPIQKKEQE